MLNEFLYRLGWFLKSYELLLVLWFLVTHFSKIGWSELLQFRPSNLSIKQQELHSSFVTTALFSFYHIVASEQGMYFLSLMMDQVDRIKLFYFSTIIIHFIFMLVLYSLHRIYGYAFSKAARVCIYTRFAYMWLLMMELVTRGYFDYHETGFIYIFGAWVCNLLAIAALSEYPVKSMLASFKRRAKTS